MDNKTHKKISCTVENCTFNDGKRTCTANQIDVGPQYACCCQDTVCATFKPNENVKNK